MSLCFKTMNVHFYVRLGGFVKLVTFYQSRKFMNPHGIQRSKNLSFRKHGHMSFRWLASIFSYTFSLALWYGLSPPNAIVFEISRRLKLGIIEKERIQTIKNIDDSKTIELSKLSVNLFWVLFAIKMAARKIVESFSQKLDLDSEILSLHHWRKQFIISFKKHLYLLLSICFNSQYK